MESNITSNSPDSIISELFNSINSIRQSNNLNLFRRDYLSEYILSSLFRLKKGPPSNNEIDAKFVSQGCVYLDKLIYPISMQINNEPNYQLYFSIIQQELNKNKNTPILSNGIYSHMGLYIKNIDINFYLVFIFSSKIASYDEVIGCNDGNILVGTILKPDHFIEGAFVKEITGIKGTSFGPKNIRYNNETKRFYICLLNSICSSINNSKKLIKTVYQTNLQNIPYGAANALGRNVDFKGGNVAENQIVSFIPEDKSQIFNGNAMDYLVNLGFPNSNSVGSATKNKLDIKSRMLAYNQNKNIDNNNKFSCTILTPKKRNSTGLSTIMEDNNDLNKSFIRNSMPRFEGISPIAIKTLSPGNYNNKKTTSDLITTINGVHISPMKKSDFSNIQNPFETKNNLMNDNPINVNNNSNKNSFNNSNINNFSFLNNNNNNSNNNIINNPINNNNGFLQKTNNLFNSINQTQNNNNNLLNNQSNNIVSSSNNNMGNVFNSSNKINNINNINNTQFNQNLFSKMNTNNNSTNYIQNNNYNNQINNINNYNRPFQNQLIKIENNVTGYQITPNNIKFKSLLDIQNIGNQNLNISPKLNLSRNQDFCINLYNINSSGTQACQTTSKPKSDLMNYIALIKKKYPITKADQIKFVQSNLQTVIEDFYGKKTVLTYEKLLNLQKERDNYDYNEDYNMIEKVGKDNINNLINKGQYLNIKFPYFDYKKEQELKDCNTQSQEINNSFNYSEIGSKSMLEKLHMKLENEYLNNEERNERYKYNPSFENLYYSHDFSDVILKLNNNIIQAHKVVLASSSKVFMELIKSAEEEFKYNRNNQGYNMNNNGTNIIEVLLPENFDFKIFNEIIKWIYCGKINGNLSVDTLRTMLIMSEKLKIIALVKILIIKYIIPQINKDNVISLCIDAYTRGNSNHETTSCWDLLLNYSLNYIGKNSISLIKTNLDKLLIMDIGLLIKCVKICMDNIVDLEQLSNLLQILIQKGIANNIFDLLYKEVEKVKMCRCYDSQNINLDLLLNYFEIKNRPFSLPLINEETVVNNNILVNNDDISINNSSNNRNSVSPFILYDNDKNNIYERNININNPSKDQSFLSTSMNSKRNNFLNNTNSNFTFGRNEESIFNTSNPNSSNLFENNSSLNLYDSNFEEEKNYNDIYNYLSPNTNTNYYENLRNDKYYVFDFIFKFPDDLKYSDINSSNGLSVFSEKFEYRGHLWSIKIDLNNKGDFSFYLIERGDSNNFDKNNSLIKYNSILFEFVIRDTNFEKSNQIFFSFAKNQHQIIGHKNFININQLTNKNKFHFVLYIKRFPLHSGIMQYLNDNFNYIFSNHKSEIDKNKNLYLLTKSNFQKYNNIKKIIKGNYYTNNLINLINSDNNNNTNFEDLKFEYLNINQFDLVSILYSDNLPVESENTVIGVIYFYCMKKDPKYIDNIMKSIRYEFVNFRILCSLARDHDTIKNCPTFRKEFKSELKKRIKKMSENNYLINNNRIYLRKNVRRNNYSINNNEDGLSGMNISDEIITFFLEKRNHEEYKDKLISLKKELKEEKRITDERIKNLEEENEQLNIEKNRLINENKKMKNKIINKGMMEQIKSYNENNNNINAFNQADDFIKQNTDINNCTIF